ncbi:2'-5' RNA ligase family protein [Streptomyces sp. NPDC026672]|uniref:2'-5' RNA ligase family protein n=1 Tax=unclassified Streptomyces TaxID=2593676 RepID=UPI0033DABBD1
MTTEPSSMRNHWWWRPGWSVGRRFYTWHITFEGQHDVHRLAAEYRSALTPLEPALTLIPDQWLHLTMQGINFVEEIAESDIEAVVGAARSRLSAVPAFDVQFGPETIDSEAVLLPARPSEPVRSVRNAIRAAMADVLGAPNVPEQADGFTPHMSVAYSAADGPVAPIVEALATLDTRSAPAHISAAELIVIHRDNQMYEWQSYATVPLG